MIQKEIAFKDIKFHECEYTKELYDSVKQKGILIAIRVNATDEGYECLDGHKRLSIINDLINNGEIITHVPCTIVNNYSKAGSSYWGNTQNHH